MHEEISTYLELLLLACSPRSYHCLVQHHRESIGLLRHCARVKVYTVISRTYPDPIRTRYPDAQATHACAQTFCFWGCACVRVSRFSSCKYIHVLFCILLKLVLARLGWLLRKIFLLVREKKIILMHVWNICYHHVIMMWKIGKRNSGWWN